MIQLTFYILLTSVLLIILFQDLKSRSIHWLTLPLLLMCILGFNNFKIDINAILLSLLFLTGTFLFLVLYLKLRTGKFLDFTKNHFGLGDVLFLIAIIPLTSFKGYVYVFTLGTLFTLVFGFITLLFSKLHTIPYAGYFSLFLIGIISILQFTTSPSFLKTLIN